jgi:uncharacterized protein with HEPN domain
MKPPAKAGMAYLCLLHDENLLRNIKDEAEVLLEMTDRYDLQSFVSSEVMKRAVSMALINIGESVKPLSKDLKQMYPMVKWSSIAGLRDIAAHGYQTLEMPQIWKTVTEDVPELLERVKGILHAEETEAENNR